MLKLVIRHALIKCGKGGAGISSSHCVAQTAVIIHVEVVTVGGPGICTINGAMQPYQNAASISICRHSADRTWYLKYEHDSVCRESALVGQNGIDI